MFLAFCSFVTKFNLELQLLKREVNEKGQGTTKILKQGQDKVKINVAFIFVLTRVNFGAQ